MTRIVPLHNLIVVEPFALGEVSKGGLLIPQVAKASTPYRLAKVLEIGPGRYAGDGTLIPCSAKIGDVVAYSKNQGVLFPLDDENGHEQELLVISEQFILGIVKDMPEQSSLTGLDGKLLRMNPNSRAPSDIADRNHDQIERAMKQGVIDSQGDTLERMVDADRLDAEAD
jgi:co-chaperonin GroES (HSP10)